jgi:hypothetical protein
MRLVVEVTSIIIGDGLPGFLGAACLGSVFSASIVSMSMSVVLRGAKTLRVNTAFGGSLTAADVGTGLVDFFAVCEVLLLEMCFLHLASLYVMEVIVLGH